MSKDPSSEERKSDAPAIEVAVGATGVRVKIPRPKKDDGWYTTALVTVEDVADVEIDGHAGVMLWGGGLWHKIVVIFWDPEMPSRRILDFKGRKVAEAKFKEYRERWPARREKR